MKQLKSFLNKEKAHFDRLNIHAQALMRSITLYYLISPIFGVFIDAFIWRKSHDPILVSFYNIVLFFGMPFGFYLNGILLRRYSAIFLHFIGLFIAGLTIAILMFLPKLSYTEIAMYGFVDGIAGGMYWANRNMLTLKTTTSENRIYFSGIESILSTYSKIFIPFLIGWFLISGAHLHWYSTLTGYKFIAVFMLIAICFAGFAIRKVKLEPIASKELFLKNVTKKWQKFRLLQFALGFMQGITNVLPTLMVLILLGKENTLGTVQSVSSIITAVVVYMLAKRLHVKHRIKLLEISFIIGLVGALAFSMLYSGVGVLLFFAAQAIMQPFIWMATNSLNYDLIDEDKDNARQCAYVSDQEIYLNSGRILSIALFIGLIMFISKDFALRYTPLIFAFAQIFLQLLARSIEKKK